MIASAKVMGDRAHGAVPLSDVERLARLNSSERDKELHA
jgi:hypothetical protein